MRLEDTEQEAAFRAKAREWIQAHRPDDATMTALEGMAHSGVPFDKSLIWKMARDWNAKKYDAGFATLSWPKEFGGLEAPELAVIFAEEEGALSRFQDYLIISQYMCAATLMMYASDKQKDALLPRIARADDIWCQMFSEPGAGSDLAAVRTKAEQVDGGWRISGQKVWTSGAQMADWGTILVRTDPTVRKHKGLTLFFLRMDSPGVEVRPIKLMSGVEKFNEVFLDNVFVPDEQRLGEANEGWRAAVRTLNAERMAIGAAIDIGANAVFELAHESGALSDDSVRRNVADWLIVEQGLRACAARQLTAIAQGEEPGPDTATIKLVGGVLIEEMASATLDLFAHTALGAKAEDRQAEALRNMFFFGPAQRAAGGSDEVLKNVIAERVLGLPSEDRQDTKLPFNKVPTQAQPASRAKAASHV